MIGMAVFPLLAVRLGPKRHINLFQLPLLRDAGDRKTEHIEDDGGGGSRSLTTA